MWRVSGGGLVSGRGASVRRLWKGLPPDLPSLHAVLERQSDHAIIFISGMMFTKTPGASCCHDVILFWHHISYRHLEASLSINQLINQSVGQSNQSNIVYPIVTFIKIQSCVSHGANVTDTKTPKLHSFFHWNNQL